MSTENQGEFHEGLPIVTIVGRPNVGKSSLFNRFLKRRQAIVDRVPGSTRDRLKAKVTWGKRSFVIQDTGGLTFARGSSLSKVIQTQVRRAVEESDLLLLVCDIHQGILPLDWQVADVLRRSGKPTLCVANKADTGPLAERAVEFHAFGFGPPVAVSGEHGRGIGELLDELVKALPKPSASSQPGSASKTLILAVVGRPNVGKSTFINRLVHQDRVAVDAVAGTTRDAIEVGFKRGDQSYRLVDTAGIRRRSRLKSIPDAVGVKHALDCMNRSDGVILMVDAKGGIRTTDLKLLGRALESGRACVVAMNKWDLVEQGKLKAYQEAFWRRAPFARFVPVVRCSAAKGIGLEEVVALTGQVALRAKELVPKKQLRRALKVLTESKGLPVRLRRLRFVGLVHGVQRPLTFKLLVRGKVRVNKPDIAFIENIVRSCVDLTGVPVKFQVVRTTN
mgnify:CR=1 FL=1